MLSVFVCQMGDKRTSDIFASVVSRFADMAFVLEVIRISVSVMEGFCCLDLINPLCVAALRIQP